MPGSTTPVPDEAIDLGQVLIRKGLVREDAVNECLRLQREMALAGRDQVPRLGELLVERGHVNQQQVIDALAEQDKQILWCPRCGIRVNVKRRADIEAYKCARCEGTLVAATGSSLSVQDSSIILVSREPLPVEVEEASKDSARKFGKYILLQEIGHGAVGVIHRAWDTYLNQYVALKLIRPPTGVPQDHDTWRETRIFSLLKEARSAVRLRHPNIVTVYDVGRVHREYYISMEYLSGATLAERIKRSRDKGEISPFYENPRRWIHMMRDLARAAHYAHTRPQPVYHCDLKPSNIFVDENDRGYIVDFGLAKDLRSIAPEESGVVRGTPSYMSPEQARGSTEEIDARTDVYGFGAILYELLTGRPPFVGDLAGVLQSVISDAPARPSDIVKAPPAPAGDSTSRRLLRVPEELEAVALKCLAKDRAERFQSAKEVAEALDRVLKAEKTARRERKEQDAAAVRADLVKAVEDSAIIRQMQEDARRTSSRLMASTVLVLALLALLTAAIVMMLARGPSAGGDLARMRLDIEGQAAAFRPDLALENFRRLASAGAGTPEYAAIELSIVEAEWIDRLQKRVVEELTRSRPKLEGLRLRNNGRIGEAEVLKATPAALLVFAGGRSTEVAWANLEPRQVLELARRALPDPTPSERMGIGLFCRLNGFQDEARASFESLRGTELEASGARYRAEPRR